MAIRRGFYGRKPRERHPWKLEIDNQRLSRLAQSVGKVDKEIGSKIANKLLNKIHLSMMGRAPRDSGTLRSSVRIEREARVGEGGSVTRRIYIANTPYQPINLKYGLKTQRRRSAARVAVFQELGYTPHTILQPWVDSRSRLAVGTKDYERFHVKKHKPFISPAFEKFTSDEVILKESEFEKILREYLVGDSGFPGIGRLGDMSSIGGL